MRNAIAKVTAVAAAIALAFTITGCSGQSDENQLQIFAANSLEKALPEVQELYSASHEGVTFADTQFKGSGDLVAQLEGGASADLLITASPSTMDSAQENGLINQDTRFNLFTNDMVVITSDKSKVTYSAADLESLVTSDDVTSIAIGDPNVVPAGKYALQCFEAMGLATYDVDEDGVIKNIVWDKSIASKMNSGADKVGTVAAYVAEGQCAIGFVYTSDLYRYAGITGILTTPAAFHKPIIYPAAICADTSKAELVADFLIFATSDPAALQIWEDYGYDMAEMPKDGVRFFLNSALNDQDNGATAGNQSNASNAESEGILAHIANLMTDMDYRPLWVSIKTSLVALVFIFILGLLAAWRSMHVRNRWKSILDSIFTIPMVLPPTVCGFLLLMLFGKSTPIGNWLIEHGIALVFTWPAAVIAAVVVGFPLMYRTVLGAFEALDTDMINAARTLGWSEITILRKLMMPLAWPSIAAGTVLAFARAMGEFGCTLFFAGNFAGVTQTMPLAIYFSWMGGATDVAVFWVVVIILFSFLVILFINLWSNHTTKYNRREAIDE